MHCELPSLHQLTALIDALVDACAATHPDPSRVPPLVTAATSLLSRALRGSTVVLCGSNWRLLLLSAIGLASKYMDDEHLCFVQLLRLHSASSAAEAPAGAPSVLQPLQPELGAPSRSKAGDVYGGVGQLPAGHLLQDSATGLPRPQGQGKGKGQGQGLGLGLGLGQGQEQGQGQFLGQGQGQPPVVRRFRVAGVTRAQLEAAEAALLRLHGRRLTQ